jgi:hypothetical protein
LRSGARRGPYSGQSRANLTWLIPRKRLVRLQPPRSRGVVQLAGHWSHKPETGVRFSSPRHARLAQRQSIAFTRRGRRSDSFSGQDAVVAQPRQRHRLQSSASEGSNPSHSMTSAYPNLWQREQVESLPSLGSNPSADIRPSSPTGRGASLRSWRLRVRIPPRTSTPPWPRPPFWRSRHRRRSPCQRPSRPIGRAVRLKSGTLRVRIPPRTRKERWS